MNMVRLGKHGTITTAVYIIKCAYTHTQTQDNAYTRLLICMYTVNYLKNTLFNMPDSNKTTKPTAAKTVLHTVAYCRKHVVSGVLQFKY